MVIMLYFGDHPPPHIHIRVAAQVIPA